MDDITRKKIKDFREENKDLELQILREKLGEYASEMWWWEMKYEHFKKVDCPEMKFYAGDNIKKLDMKVKSILRKINRLEGNEMKGDITNEMIQAAREYPFNDLHQFKNGTCICPFHADKDPSMKLYKNNTVHCFSCNKSWDTIAFIRELEGLSFQEAVRRLQ